MLCTTVDNYLQTCNVAFDFRKFRHQFVYFQFSNTGKAQIQYRLSLLFRQVETLAQFCACVRCACRAFDDTDHFVDILYGNYQALQNVLTSLSLFQFKLAAAQNDFALIHHVVGNYIEQSHKLRLTVGNGNHVDTVGHFQLTVLVQKGNRAVDVGVLAQFDYGTHTFLVTFVYNFSNALEHILLFVLKRSDLHKQICLVKPVRNFRNYDVFSVAVCRFDVHFGADYDFAFAGFVGLLQAVAGDDETTRREVRSLDDLHHLVETDVFVVDVGNYALYYFTEVVRRNICRKTYGNTRCAVDKQVGETPGQHVRFLGGIVEVARPAHGVLFDVAKQFQRVRGQFCLGVTHCRRAVAVDVAEVALSKDKGHVHCKGLRHTHHCVVNTAVAVGVIPTHAVTYDTRRFTRGLVGGVALFVHAVQYAALHRLQAVLYARKRTVENNVFGVGHHGFAHDDFHRFGKKVTAVLHFFDVAVFEVEYINLFHLALPPTPILQRRRPCLC